MQVQLQWLIIAIVGLTSLQHAPSDPIQEEPGPQPVPRTADANSSCLAPSKAQVELCATLERSILDSVVRLEVRAPDGKGGWEGGKGHATVMKGRYLVTHNHFGVRLSTFETMENTGAAAVSLYRANGEKILLEAPPFKETLTLFVCPELEHQTLGVLSHALEDRRRGFQPALLPTRPDAPKCGTSRVPHCLAGRTANA